MTSIKMRAVIKQNEINKNESNTCMTNDEPLWDGIQPIQIL